MRFQIFLLLFYSYQKWFLFDYVLSTVPTTDGFHLPVLSVSQKKTITSRRRIDMALEVSTSETREEEVQHKMWTYVNSLQRDRKAGKTRAARSLAYYFKNETLFRGNREADMTPDCQFSELIERALTQAFRICGDVGDYRLIIELVENAIVFTNSEPLLPPRVFGEAINALSRTSASLSKVKQIWRLASTSNQFLTQSLSAYELNVFLKVLSDRKKTSACIAAYRDHTCPSPESGKEASLIQPDSITVSTLFEALLASIDIEQPLVATQIYSTEEAYQFTPIEASMKRLTKSQCWQWNTAVDLLSTLRDKSLWNNHVFSSLLKLNGKAQQLHAHANGPDITMAIIESMIASDIEPDTVTCTLAIKIIGNQDDEVNRMSWRLALRLLEMMKSDGRFPSPNAHAYSAAVTACARAGNLEVSMDLLEEMRNNMTVRKHDQDKTKKSFDVPPPTTWVYNSVLAALVQQERGKGKRPSQEPRSSKKTPEGLALKLLEQMKNDHIRLDLETAPDTVTYNTILSSNAFGDGTEADDKIFSLLLEMDTSGIQKDHITYISAIRAVSDCSNIVRLLKENILHMEQPKSSPSTFLAVVNAALARLASLSNFKAFREVLLLVEAKALPADNVSLEHVIDILCRSDRSNVVLSILRSVGKNNPQENDPLLISEVLGLDLANLGQFSASQQLYAWAIEKSLLVDDFETARTILSMSRADGFTPDVETLSGFARAYAQSAIRSTRKDRIKATPSVLRAEEKAQSGYKIASSLRSVPVPTLSSVAYACAYTGQWEEAQSILRQVHDTVAEGYTLSLRSIDMTRTLHSNLLREAARQGNVTAALGYANDIQNFGGVIRTLEEKIAQQMNGRVLDEQVVWWQDEPEPPSRALPLAGMRAEDWVMVISAASKSGHWRVCVNAMQFLKKYIQNTHPKHANEANEGMLDSRYEQLAPALVAATECFEKRSQYAWAVRVMDEWIEWSGREPRPQAVLSAVRILSARGRGEEVKNLLSRCIQDEGINKYAKRGISYETNLYLGSLTALHNSGLYDDADEVFMMGIQQEYLPFNFGKGDAGGYVLDLHGMNVAMAHSAVRVALRRLVAEGGDGNGLTIITGRGRNSALRMRPVLRPEVQRMLLEEFYPPLNTVSLPGNTGALEVYEADISAWQNHQQEQRGARMMTLASLLKNASTDRLQSIALKLSASEG